MSTASEKTIQALEQVVKGLPVGTNLALLHLIWTMITGSFLSSRGAVFGALKQAGFSRQESQRSWQAMRGGSWSIDKLVENWRQYVLAENEWRPNCYEGYRPLSVDTTTFWRPRLAKWIGQYFHRLANRTQKGVGFGLLVQIGQIQGKRIPLLKAIIPAAVETSSEKAFKGKILWHAAQHLADDEVAVHDAGVSIADMQAAGMPRYVVRLASNCTGRRNYLPDYVGKGRHRHYGAIERPLPRTHNGRTIRATKPDVETDFDYQGRTIRVQGWYDLVNRDKKVWEENQLFTIWVFFDPLYQDPLVVGTNLSASFETIFQLYIDRWPVEQVPLVAKQLLGLHRHFVWALLSCLRLPALALLAANILTYLAAVLPPMPTGFWDRQPKKLRVVCDELWLRSIFHMTTPLMGNFAKNVHIQPICQKVLTPVGWPKPILEPVFSHRSAYSNLVC